MTLLERAIACYARFCLRAFILAGEALGDALILSLLEIAP